MGLKLNSASGGSIEIVPAATASTLTLTAPAKTGNLITSADTNTITQGMMASGVGSTGPAFGVYSSVSQTGLASNQYYKIAFNTEEYDTAGLFDKVTNYRFTPNIAGYYMFNQTVYLSATNLSSVGAVIYKNGSLFKTLQSFQLVSGASVILIGGSALIYLNGTTDYVEFYGWATTTSGTFTINADSRYTYASGFLARAA